MAEAASVYADSAFLKTWWFPAMEKCNLIIYVAVF